MNSVIMIVKIPPFTDQSPSLKFIQLYTSPTYEDFHSLLVQPEIASDPLKSDEEKHRFSPIICRGVCDGGQIVWANTRVSEGLNGRTDLPLNTAVGVPICSIGHDLYILVLFAVGIITMTPHAVEYLTTVSRAVTQVSTGFLSAAYSSRVEVSPAKTEDFIGLWDINELINKYSNEVEFHLLPIGKLQRFFDCNEILLFCDLFMDFKLSRDGRFTVKQLESLRETYRQSRERSESLSSEESKSWDIEGDKENEVEGGAGTEESKDRVVADGQRNGTVRRARDRGNSEVGGGLFVVDGEIVDQPSERPAVGTYSTKTLAPPNPLGTEGVSIKSIVPLPPLLPGNLDNGDEEFVGPGVYCIDLNSIVCEVEPGVEDGDEISPGLKKSNSSSSIVKLCTENDINKSILHIYAHMTYKLSQCRFHEFMIAIMGMTVFEAAELWMVSEKTSELFLVAAVYRSPSMQQWISLSETLRLKIGTEGPGKIVETGRPLWDADYAKRSTVDSSANVLDPRLQAARDYNVNTAFGVPLPGLRGICGTVMFYSSKTNFPAEPLIIQLVEKAINLMATSSLDATSWTRLEVKVVDAIHRESHQQQQQLPMIRWLQDQDEAAALAANTSANGSSSANAGSTAIVSRSNQQKASSQSMQQSNHQQPVSQQNALSSSSAPASTSQPIQPQQNPTPSQHITQQTQQQQQQVHQQPTPSSHQQQSQQQSQSYPSSNHNYPQHPQNVPQNLPAQLPSQLPPNLPPNLPATLPTSLPPNLPPNLPPQLPPGLPAQLPASTPTNSNSLGNSMTQLPVHNPYQPHPHTYYHPTSGNYIHSVTGQPVPYSNIFPRNGPFYPQHPHAPPMPHHMQYPPGPGQYPHHPGMPPHYPPHYQQPPYGYPYAYPPHGHHGPPPGPPHDPAMGQYMPHDFQATMMRYTGNNLHVISEMTSQGDENPIKATQMMINQRLSNFDQRLEYWRSLVNNPNHPDTQIPPGPPPAPNHVPHPVQQQQQQQPSQHHQQSVMNDPYSNIGNKMPNQNNGPMSADYSHLADNGQNRQVGHGPVDPSVLTAINPYLHHRSMSRGNSANQLFGMQGPTSGNESGGLTKQQGSSKNLSSLMSKTPASGVGSSSGGNVGSSNGNGFTYADGVNISDAMGEEWNDPVVNAAYTLANFGKVSVQWANFLEGSNNETNFQVKLESSKVVEAVTDGKASRLTGNKRGIDATTGLHKCKVDDCQNLVENNTVQYCATHRGTRRCQHDGCTKCAQGATKYCIAHGGGRRCTFPNCFKGARDKFFCAAHGGGKRCTFENCNKSAVGGSNLCTAHGGGKRCQFEGCNKSSQSSTNYCVRHGGGRSCGFAGCTKVITFRPFC